MAAEYLIQDPHHNYASAFIDLMHRKYGMRAVCFFTDADEYRAMRSRVPSQRDVRIAAHYMVDDGDLRGFADMLKREHQIGAILPYYEQSLGPAEVLAEHLGISWAQPGVVDRFRDKFALKEHLWSQESGLRLNSIARVRGLSDVVAAIETDRFPRFVLKPNDGGGNSNIGFFESAGDVAHLEEYLSGVAGTELLMEEYIGGVEYYANGQVDAAGAVHIITVGRYDRRAVNDRENVAYGTSTVRTSELEFRLVADYSVSVMQATGLRRCPFHLELKIDDRGPCLIEVGARLAGSDRAPDDNRVHGNLDVIDLAAHYYVTDEDYGPVRLDWEHYDSVVHGHVNGISTQHGRVYDLRGVSEVEQAPGFVRWVQRPRIGQRLLPSIGIGEFAWIASFEAPTLEDFAAVSEWARQTIRINNDSQPLVRPARRAVGDLPGVARSLKRKALNTLGPSPTPHTGVRSPSDIAPGDAASQHATF